MNNYDALEMNICIHRIKMASIVYIDTLVSRHVRNHIVEEVWTALNRDSLFDQVSRSYDLTIP